MTKKNSMQKEVEKTEKGEQMQLIDVGPENLKAIAAEVRIYKGHQKDRLAAGKKEFEQKEKIKKLVKETNLHRLQDGTIRFEADHAIVCLTPQDELITIKEKKPAKSKKK